MARHAVPRPGQPARRWLRLSRVLDDGNQARGVRRPLRHDLPELAQVAAQGVDRLRALADQQLASAEDHRGALGLLALHGHEAHRGSLRCLADRLRVRRIVLLPLHEGFDVGGRDETDLVAQLADLAAPEMRAAAGFHRHQARRQVAEERQYLIPSQLLAQNTKPRRVSAMHLKHSLRQVEHDRDNLRHDRPPLWILADPPWHIDAVGGRSHHQSPVREKGVPTISRSVQRDPPALCDGKVHR
jgi:hypothetical protein